MRLVLAACILAFGVGLARAGEDARPLWELGIGLSALQIPDYRGAEETQNLLLPFIYPVYRGDFLRMDEYGIHGRLFRSDRLKLEVSADGAAPSRSEGDSVRAGMPDLSASFQLGPELQYTAIRTADPDTHLKLHMPYRGVFTIDSSGIDYIGTTFSPYLAWRGKIDLGDKDWKYRLSAGLESGSRGYHAYYYDVAPEYATAIRPAYESTSGYGGSQYIASVKRRYPDYWVSMFARYDRVDNAVFADSPLVTSRDGLTFGVVFAWFVARSQRAGLPE